MNQSHNEIWDEELAERLLMNSQAWELLLEKGYTPGQKTRVEFTFVTEKRANALKLKAFLETKPGYTIKVINNDDEFEVACHADMELSLESLNPWVTMMVQEARKCDSMFDGWIAPQILMGKAMEGKLEIGAVDF
ncbi:MAG TPA: ribonuclease E inhibitor RraB [Verrucomicrobiae bacterium]|nr:ribonuclease E inhibitor RraB [Verrucomicrobiae bacterium]